MFKRILSTVLSAATVVGMIPHIPAKAEENGSQSYPYTFFASSSEDGAITVNAGNFCVNGNVATNGTIVSNGNININGTRTEQAAESMIYIFDKINTRYFSGSNIDEHEEDYSLEELNIDINIPTEVNGEATLTGNININSALNALKNVNLYGEVKNTNDSVIFSKYGDIVIDSQNVNLNGLVYAPFGNVTVNAQNLNLNNVVIIAQSIVLTCPNVNANNSSSMRSFVGSESEPLDIPYGEWEYMKDENENGFPDFFEDTNNWFLLNDSDGDKLPDCVEVFIGSEPLNIDTDNDGINDCYEVFVLFTDPTLEDSDENGISDYDEDFDEDSLINGQEYLLETDPWNNDSDNDDISDGDEVNTYHTDPMNKDTDNDKLEDSDELLFNTDPNNPDTNGNGILDGDEKFAQTFTYTVENEDCAVEEVIISMNGTGNIQKNTSVESIMNKDMICSDVVGLVGEPFEIETESQFDNATLSFKINRSKLGDTDFNDLMFLWYDEENYEFVELETFYDDTNSIVSINTTHFSRYMVVDKNMWFEAWSEDLNQTSNSYEKSACYFVLAVDCSGSMRVNDPTTTISPSSPPYKPVNMCERHKAVSNFASSLDYDDKAAIVTFEDSAKIICEMTNNESDLYWASANFYNSGGTSFDAAISKSVEILNNNPSATRKKIILLTDGQSSISNAILQEAIDSHIKIYTIGLGNSSDGILERIAQETGGEFFKAYAAQELVSIYTNNGFDNDFDTTDTDGDGLYDVVETAGIRIQNGKELFNNSPNDLVFTDPTNPDTDYDGLKDGEEIDPTLRYKKIYWCPPEIDSPNKRSYYFAMKSDPTKIDSDNDGIPDKYVERTMADKVDFTFDDPNPLESDVKRTALKRDLFQVKKDNGTSYGGDQGWFDGDSDDYCNGKVSGEEISNYGCGLIAMCNVLLYLGIDNEDYRNWSEYVDKNTGIISKSDYMSFVKKMSNYFVLRGWLGVPAKLPFDLLSGSLEEGFNSFSEEYDWELDSEWASESNGDDVYCTIKSMLKNDIPVILAYSADVNKYLTKPYKTNKSRIIVNMLLSSLGPVGASAIGFLSAYNATHEYIKLQLYIFNGDKFGEYSSIDSHYVTVTEISEFSESLQEKLNCGKVMLKTSSWGKALYIDYDEYKDYIDSFTNILEIY